MLVCLLPTGLLRLLQAGPAEDKLSRRSEEVAPEHMHCFYTARRIVKKKALQSFTKAATLCAANSCDIKQLPDAAGQTVLRSDRFSEPRGCAFTV